MGVGLVSGKFIFKLKLTRNPKAIVCTLVKLKDCSINIIFIVLILRNYCRISCSVCVSIIAFSLHGLHGHGLPWYGFPECGPPQRLENYYLVIRTIPPEYDRKYFLSSLGEKFTLGTSINDVQFQRRQMGPKRPQILDVIE